MKKKNEVELQENNMNVGLLHERIYASQSNMNMDEQIIHTHEHIDESNIQNVKAEVSIDTGHQQAHFNHISQQAHSSNHVSQQAHSSNRVCVKCLQEKLEEMINEVKEIKHQLTLSKNDLQAYLTTVQNTNIRMDQIEQTISKVTDHPNEKTNEKRKNYPYVQRKKERREKER